MPSGTQYWLLKTEPETYSIQDLGRDGKTNWNNVRNFQARNFIRKMKKGDLALIYHSGDERAVVGTCTITKEAYVDPDADGGDWSQTDVSYLSSFKKPVPLATIKSDPKLAGLMLIKQSRLSVMPITASEFKHLETLSK
jgi:predicted RNA-binding protein with PUA-like domain